MKLVKIDTQTLVVKDRLRSILGPKDGNESILGLAQSMKDQGQIQPIVVKGIELIAGGRRVAAAMFLLRNGEGIGFTLPENDPRKLPPGHILAVQFDDLPRADQIKIEIEENTKRKNLTKAEEALGIRRLQQLLNEQAALEGNANVHVRQVAQAAGVSSAHVSMSLRVAKAVIEGGNTDLLKKESVFSAYNTLQNQEKTAKRISEIAKSIPADQLAKNLFNLRAEDWITKIPPKSIDIWSFDPPWGIGIDEYDRQQKYDGDWSDDRDHAKKLMEVLVPELYRTLKDDSWTFSFFGIQFYNDFRTLLEKVGFKVYPVPYIWFKPNKLGAQNDPSRFDINMWEPFFLCAKGEPRIFKQVQGNVLSYNMPPRNDRFHFAQKPVELYKDILERFSFGNMTVGDPTAGSFAIVKAAKALGRSYMACESNKENYDNGIIFVNTPEGK